MPKNKKTKGAKGAKTTHSQVPANPYMDEEFESFMDSLSDASLPLWKPIAKTLGIHRNTISRWSKHPRAIEAKRRGLDVAIQGMAMAGMTNYQMWEKYLHLLGLANNLDEDDTQEQDELTGEIKEIAQMMRLNGGTNDRPVDNESDSGQEAD